MRMLPGVILSLLVVAVVRVLPVVAIGAGVLHFAPPTLVAPGALQRVASDGLDRLARQVANLDPRPGYRTISVLDGRTLQSEVAHRRQTIVAGAEIKRIGD